MDENAYQELWERQRKRTRVQRWVSFFFVASIFFAYFVAPHIGVYFILDKVLPIVKESFTDKEAGSDKTRRFIFTNLSAAEVFTTKLSHLNIPYEIRHSATEPYVIKVSESHIISATKIFNKIGIQPDFTDVVLDVKEKEIRVEATTIIHR